MHFPRFIMPFVLMEALGGPADFSAQLMPTQRMKNHFPLLASTYNYTGNFPGSPSLAFGIEGIERQGEQLKVRRIFSGFRNVRQIERCLSHLRN